MPSAAGNLTWTPIADALELVAPPVAAAAGTVPGARVAAIDPHLADTAAFCAEYDVSLDASANCVVVHGRRSETEKHAAVVVLAVDRADINKTVRKELGVRKLSFADQDETEATTSMTSGGITPIGLPADWEILVDEAVAHAGPVVLGGGVRSAKILIDGADLAALPNARVLPLALPRL